MTNKPTANIFPVLVSILTLGSALTGQGARAATTFSAMKKVGNAAPMFGSIVPNKMNAAQARATILSEKDGFYLRAEKAFPASSPVVSLPSTHWNLLGHGDRSDKMIALTFDDGPHPAYTPQLLGVLAKYNVPATFFLVGEMAERAPNLVRAEIAAGDSVGNHTYHHVSLVKVTPDEAATEIDACGLVLQSITGKAAHLFRPPGGRFDPAVAEEAAAQGYTTVLWTDDPGDYTSPGVDIIVNRTVDTAHNGGILLLHDGVQQTIDALPRIIDTLRERGYQFVTVDKMLAEDRGPAPHPGVPHLHI